MSKGNEYKLGIELGYFTICEIHIREEYQDLFKHMLDDLYSDERKGDDDNPNYFETDEEFVHSDNLGLIVDEVMDYKLEEYLREKYNNSITSVPKHYCPEVIKKNEKKWEKFSNE